MWKSRVPGTVPAIRPAQPVESDQEVRSPVSDTTTPDLTPELSAPYSTDLDELLDALSTRRDGLSAAEASQRLETHGPNRLPEPERPGVVARFLSHFRDVLIIVLLVAAALTAVLQEWIDTIVILGVVLVNATIGFVQEGRAEQAIEGIRRMLSARAVVRRDDEWVDVDAEEVVPGDVLRLSAGDRVAADVRLLSVTNLSIEESALTGESVPSGKEVTTLAADTPVGDRENMAFSGSIVAQGQGWGVVTATGSATELGRITTMISEVEAIETPLTRQMARFGKVLSAAILAMAVGLIGIGTLLHGLDVDGLLLAAISFAVAAIPEGLPAILTITLAIGVQRMARRNAITRRLNAVETLGSVTVICSDKTGTLTRNEMTARRVVTAGADYEVGGVGYAPEGEILADGDPVGDDLPPDLAPLIEVMGVCNDGRLVEGDDGWEVAGDPTEGAMLALAAKAGVDASAWQRRASVPFESEHKLMGTLEVAPDGRVEVLVKGAPERLLDRSAAQIGADGAQVPLDRAAWEEHAGEIARAGMRVLAAARRSADAEADRLELADLDEGLVFAGLVGIQDPPRPEAIEAIADCRRAGIRVKMITGDHADTAGAIGAEMGIGGEHAVVTGPELEAATDEELAELAVDRDVFARTSPEHKLRIVTALQAAGEVVAMTGDGVNDAPALKRADVGVAMGVKGSEATKEAAEIVLADDNFESIERAVEEGRTIYDNLRKSIMFILPTNGAQALVMLVAVVFGMELPLTPVQILWVNMVTAVTLALALAFEAGEPGLMQRPPRPPGGSILDREFLQRLVMVSVLMGGATVLMFLWTEASGHSLEFARTVALTTLVVAEVFYLFNARYLRAPSWPPAGVVGNRGVWVAIGVLAVLQLGFVYAPFMNTAFGSEPLALGDWLIPAIIGAAIFVVVEIEKAIVTRRSALTAEPALTAPSARS